MVLVGFSRENPSSFGGIAKPLFQGKFVLSFFFVGRMDGCFLQAVEGENGQSAAPRTSRAHRYVMPQSLGPHVNVCDVLCHALSFILHDLSLDAKLASDSAL